MAYPTLNQNTIYSNLYNQIVGITVEGKNIADTHAKLLNAMRLDVSKYGDTKIFIDTDVLESYDFTQDSQDALNVLSVKRSQPVQTTVTIDKARQIMVTVDDFGISSRAFGSEGAFGAFNSAVVAWVGMTKEIYEASYYNVYFGNAKAEYGNQNLTVAASETATLAQAMATKLADLFVELSVPSRDYNDKKLLRSFDQSDVMCVWNSKYMNEIKKIDLPILFHGESLAPDAAYVLAPRYFGRAIASDDIGNDKLIHTNGEVDATKGAVRSKIEITFTFEGEKVHMFPGDALATGMKVAYEGGSVANPDFSENEVYVEDADVVCKIVGKGALPFLTGVSAGTEFYNGKNNSRNHYLTWTFGTGRLDAKPLITIKKA